MSIAELIYQHVKTLPDYKAQEVLDFVEFLEYKQQFDVLKPSLWQFIQEFRAAVDLKALDIEEVLKDVRSKEIGRTVDL